jgi:ABC-type sulfate/molybdate transport systems ATPase subunit
LLVAFRLAVAERLGPHRIILLEEPFAHLDAQRRGGALAMLRSFQMQTGWQVILITRDANLADAAAELFATPTIVDLANVA